LHQPEKELKKIKYWLKIAHNVSVQVERELEFLDFIKTVRNTYKEEKLLVSMLDTNFPSHTMDSS